MCWGLLLEWMEWGVKVVISYCRISRSAGSIGGAVCDPVILTGIVLIELYSAGPKEKCSTLWTGVASGAGSC